MNIIPVILAGGTGSRLWPLSRTMYPKQFYPLLDDELTMLQQTCLRIQKLTNKAPVVVSNVNHRFIVSEQLHQIAITADILLEPVGRDSAAGISVAAHHVSKKYGKDAVMIVLPADHHIGDEEAFAKAIQIANTASQGNLVIFGIKPTYPETGYGYIKAANTKSETEQLLMVDEFKEKPDAVTAKAYIDSEEYYWNSGMFVFSVSLLLSELSKYEPEIVVTTQQAVELAVTDLDFVRLDTQAFEESPKTSIDYALMERSDKVVMVALDASWNDVGSWKSLWDTLAKDSDYNASKGDVLLANTTNSLVVSNDKKAVVLGLDNIVLVDTKDAILVADIKESQTVKKIVEDLKVDEHAQALTELHREVYRPWGHYDSIDNGDRYQVKRITVNPGEKLSVQMHHHRAEHWIVVSGTAKVSIDNKEQLVTENQSVYIPVGAVHSLENPGKIPLDMIEVQSGSYLGEDDIVRFEDRYGRS